MIKMINNYIVWNGERKTKAPELEEEYSKLEEKVV